jgi:hypothetical protein
MNVIEIETSLPISLDRVRPDAAEVCARMR